MYKRGILGGFRPWLLKIDTSVDEDIECQSQYQIRKGSIKGLKDEKAKMTQKNLLNMSFPTVLERKMQELLDLFQIKRKAA